MDAIGQGLLGIAQNTVLGAVIGGVRVFNKAHRVWFWQQRIDELCGSADARQMYAKGALITVLVNGTPMKKPVEQMAQIAAIGVELMNSIDEMYEFRDSCREVATSISQSHIFRVKIKMQQSSETSFDPTLTMQNKIMLYRLTVRVQDLAVHSFSVFWSIFKLCSSLANLIDQYNSDEFTELDNKNRIVLNLSKIGEQIERNQKRIQCEFETNHTTIHRFLRLIGNEDTISGIKKMASESIKITQAPAKVISKGANAFWEGASYLMSSLFGGSVEEKKESLLLINQNDVDKRVTLVFQGLNLQLIPEYVV